MSWTVKSIHTKGVIQRIFTAKTFLESQAKTIPSTALTFYAKSIPKIRAVEAVQEGAGEEEMVEIRVEMEMEETRDNKIKANLNPKPRLLLLLPLPLPKTVAMVTREMAEAIGEIMGVIRIKIKGETMVKVISKMEMELRVAMS